MIRTRGLTKRYGTTTALDQVDLTVPPGSIFGLVGPNGAGKTTMLGILAGLRTATAGSVEIEVPPNRVGVLPDTPQFEPWLTAREVVGLARTLTGPDVPEDRIDEVLGEAGLADDADRAVGGFSRGMLQRLGVASTVVSNPDLLMLDEPSSALDPMGRREVLDLVHRLRGDATVLFSSHILGDVQEVSDMVAILDRGRILYQGPINDLLVGAATPAYRVTVNGDPTPIAAALRRAEFVTAATVDQPDTIRIEVTDTASAEGNLVGTLADVEARVISMSPESVTLEQVFLELTS